MWIIFWLFRNSFHNRFEIWMTDGIFFCFCCNFHLDNSITEQKEKWSLLMKFWPLCLSLAKKTRASRKQPSSISVQAKPLAEWSSATFILLVGSWFDSWQEKTFAFNHQTSILLKKCSYPKDHQRGSKNHQPDWWRNTQRCTAYSESVKIEQLFILESNYCNLNYN